MRRPLPYSQSTAASLFSWAKRLKFHSSSFFHYLTRFPALLHGHIISCWLLLCYRKLVLDLGICASVYFDIVQWIQLFFGFHLLHFWLEIRFLSMNFRVAISVQLFLWLVIQSTPSSQLDSYRRLASFAFLSRLGRLDLLIVLSFLFARVCPNQRHHLHPLC